MSEQIKKFNKNCGIFEIILIVILFSFGIFSFAVYDKPLPIFIGAVLQCTQLAVFNYVSRRIEYPKSQCCYILVRALFNAANMALTLGLLFFLSDKKSGGGFIVVLTFVSVVAIDMLCWMTVIPIYGCCRYYKDPNGAQHDRQRAHVI